MSIIVSEVKGTTRNAEIIKMITQINKTDTFRMYNEIYCVTKINNTEYTCENVLNEIDTITMQDDQILDVVNNESIFND